jgi:hypothetical protein
MTSLWDHAQVTMTDNGEPGSSDTIGILPPVVATSWSKGTTGSLMAPDMALTDWSAYHGQEASRKRVRPSLNEPGPGAGTHGRDRV